MNRLLTGANKKLGIGSAATLLAAAGFLGTFLGVLRTKLINANFIPFESDAYFAAFKIPDLVFFTLASGALGVAFLPILSERLQKNRQSAWEVATYLLNLLAIISFLASIIIVIFARPIMGLVASGFTPEQLDLSVAIMRIVSVNIFLFAISTVLTTVQQSVGRFFFMAIAPLFYNGAIIASIYIFGDKFGIVGLSLGVALGAILQLGVVAFGMVGLNFKYRPKIDFKNKSFLEILRILPARSIDQGVDYINGIVETRFASRLAIGSVTNYENAALLHMAPIMLIGNAISTASFPRLTTNLAQGRTDLYRKEFIRVFTTMIWLSLPVVIVAYFTRGYLARIIFARDNREIALIFGFLCVAIFFRILYTMLSRYFYAHKDTKTPLYVSLFTITFNVFLAYNLSKPGGPYGVVGLAIAQSIVAFTEDAILIAIIVKRDPKLFNKKFMKNLLRIIAVSGFTLLSGLLVVEFFPLMRGDQSIAIISKLVIITVTVFSVHVIASYIFDLNEAKFVFNKLKRMIFRPVKI